MSLGLVGKKIGMTREFFTSGISIPVTVVKIEKGRVIDIYTKEKNGYSAVKLGFVKIKNSKLTNQMKGFFTKKNTEPKKIIKEYRVEKPEEFQTLTINFFNEKKYKNYHFKKRALTFSKKIYSSFFENSALKTLKYIR